MYNEGKLSVVNFIIHEGCGKMMSTSVVFEEPETYDATKQTPDYDGLWNKLIEDLFN